MRVDKEAFKKHLELSSFIYGEQKGKWAVLGDPEWPDWPKVLIWVKAAVKPNGPSGFYFRFDLTNYPAIAPTACPWDKEKNERLEFEIWPAGPKFVSSVFRRAGWAGGNALYAPCDRLGDLSGHPAWKQQHPEYFWNKETSTIITYLNFLNAMLNSNDYASS